MLVVVLAVVAALMVLRLAGLRARERHARRRRRIRMLPQMSPQLLVVEDDDGIAAPLQRTLEREGYTVERVATGQAGLDRVAQGGIDLVVLDLGLPDLDGLEVCRRMRADGYQDALLILTARGGELDRVVGLDVGADDYLAKPFALAELLARTRALLRRFTRTAARTRRPVGGGAPAVRLPVPASVRRTPCRRASPRDVAARRDRVRAAPAAAGDLRPASGSTCSPAGCGSAAPRSC